MVSVRCLSVLFQFNKTYNLWAFTLHINRVFQIFYDARRRHTLNQIVYAIEVIVLLIVPLSYISWNNTLRNNWNHLVGKKPPCVWATDTLCILKDCLNSSVSCSCSVSGFQDLYEGVTFSGNVRALLYHSKTWPESDNARVYICQDSGH